MWPDPTHADLPAPVSIGGLTISRTLPLFRSPDGDGGVENDKGGCVERRETRSVDQFKGTGSLSQGGVTLSPTDYAVEVWQGFIIIPKSDGTTEELAGIPELDIRLSNHQLDTSNLWQEHATLTLHLDDGRHVEGFLDVIDSFQGPIK